MDLKCMRENPELIRIFLKDLVQNLSLGASKNNDAEPDNDFRHIELFLQDEFNKNLTKLIDEMWENYDISSKMKHLHELEKQAHPDYIAWRPTTGVVPILTLKGNASTSLKEKLIVEINNNLLKINSLKEELVKKLQVVEKSEQTIEDNEKLLLQIYNEYKNIVDCGTESNN